MPRQQRLHQYAEEASRLNHNFDDPPLPLIEVSVSTGVRP